MTEKNFCITLVKLSCVALWDIRGISEGLGFLPTSEICPASHRVQADRFTERVLLSYREVLSVDLPHYLFDSYHLTLHWHLPFIKLLPNPPERQWWLPCLVWLLLRFLSGPQFPNLPESRGCLPCLVRLWPYWEIYSKSCYSLNLLALFHQGTQFLKYHNTHL